MSSRIVIPDLGGGGRAPDTTPPASFYDLGTKIRAAIAAGVFVAVFLMILMFVGLGLLRQLALAVGMGWADTPWEIYLGIPVLAGVIGLGVTCYLGFEWVIKVAVRAWAVDDDVRAYERKLAEDARKEQDEAAKRAMNNIRRGPMDHDRDPDTLTLEQRYWVVAHEVLSRATLGRGKPTREQMVADGVCSQAEWNLVNEAMCKIGLKKGYTWQPVAFDQAWDTFQANFRIQQDGDGKIYAWAMKPGQNWKVVERLA